METVQVVVTLMFAAAGITLGVLGYIGRHDRPAGETLWFLVGALFFLIIPALAVTGGSEVAVLIWLFTLLVGAPVAGLVIEFRRGRESRRIRDLAIADGLDPKEARRQYRRAPRGFLTILVIYVGVAFVWILACVAVTILVFESVQLIERPTVLIPMPSGKSLVAPWWMAVVLMIEAVGVVHAFVNAFRRGL